MNSLHIKGFGDKIYNQSISTDIRKVGAKWIIRDKNKGETCCCAICHFYLHEIEPKCTRFTYRFLK